MSDPLYLYFLPDQQEPIRSPYPPLSCGNLYPIKTQCLNAVSGRVWECIQMHGGQGFTILKRGDPNQKNPLLLTHALLLGLQV